MGQENSERTGMLGALQESTEAIKNCAAKLVYAKEFLLSLAEQDHCKQLPRGIDPSLLRSPESEPVDGAIAIPASSSRSSIRGNRENDACSASPPDMPEWRKPSSLPGSSFAQQGLRQPESNNISGARSGPSQGDNASSRNMDRAGTSRWERTTRGERDRDRTRLHREDSTESGGRPHGGGLVRSGAVSQEHDGLLGSGGPIVQRGVPQVRTQDRHQVSGRTGRMARTTEQYQPIVRGTKFSRREDSDSVNDETFGSEGHSNEERIEQERERRDLFEQMRKEQRQKTKDVSKKPGDNWIWDGEQNNDVLLSSSPGTPQSSSSSKDDTVKAQSRPVTTPSTLRHLVPPGFSKVPPQKTSSLKESNEALKSTIAEVMPAVKQTDIGKEESENLSYMMQENVHSHNDDMLQPPVESKSAHWFPVPGEHFVESLDKQTSIPKTKTGTIEGIWSGQTKYPEEGSDELEAVDKLFAKKDASLVNPSLTEALGLVKLSSLEDKSNPISDMVPRRSQGFVLPMPDGPSLEDVERMMTATTHANPILMNNVRAPPVFLTCEDLEQSFLAQTVSSNDEGNAFSSGAVLRQETAHTQKGSLRENGDNIVSQKDDKVVENASQHILSLLQKGTEKLSETKNLGSVLSTESTIHLPPDEQRLEGFKSTEAFGQKSEVISLEILFGKAFANELRTVAEPVSSKVADDSVYTARGNGLQSLLDVMSSNKQQGLHVDVGKRGKQSIDGLSERDKKLESSLEPDVHKAPWFDMIPHGRMHMDNLVIDDSSGRGPLKGARLGEVEERKLSMQSQQGHFQHQVHYDEHFASNQLQHGKPVVSMHEHHLVHDALSRDIGMMPENRSFNLQGSFFQQNHHVQSQGLDEVQPTFKIAAPFGPDSAQGLNHHHMHNRAGMNINPQWFASDPYRSSPGIEGFQAYHYPAAHRNHPDFGMLSQHMHGNVHPTSSIVDTFSNSGTRQSPFAPGFEGYVASSNRRAGNG